MKTGFRTFAVDAGFARRSASYLAKQGYRRGQIRSALVEELDVTNEYADQVISALAA